MLLIEIKGNIKRYSIIIKLIVLKIDSQLIGNR